MTNSEIILTILFYGISSVIFMLCMKFCKKRNIELENSEIENKEKLIKINKLFFSIGLIYSMLTTFSLIVISIVGIPIIFMNNSFLLETESAFISNCVYLFSAVLSTILNLEFISFAKNNIFKI